MECDIGAQTPGEQARIAEAIALYRRFRPLIHAGDVVRFDTEDSVMAHGAYAADRGEALVSFAQLTRSQQQVPARWLLPGLPFDARYTIRRIDLPGEVLGMALSQPAWWAAGEPLVLTGRQLALHGLQPPVLHPETAVLVHLDRVV